MKMQQLRIFELFSKNVYQFSHVVVILVDKLSSWMIGILVFNVSQKYLFNRLVDYRETLNIIRATAQITGAKVFEIPHTKNIHTHNKQKLIKNVIQTCQYILSENLHKKKLF